MISVSRLERQHAEIHKAMAAVMLAIDAGEVSSKATSLTAMLDDISGLVGSHLDIEDSEVYPTLIESMDPDVRRTAQQFRDNMSGIAQEFEGYAEKYRVPGCITSNAALFCYETRRIFERLRYRMKREENDLYPLVGSQERATAESAADM
jgi:hypothetical protein